MQQLDKDKAYWYVLGTTTVNREIKIFDTLRLQHIECFVPLKYQVKRVRGQQQEKLVPAISGLIFAYGTEDELKAYMLTSKDRLFFRNSAYSKHQERLIVPEHAMQQFMYFIAENQQVVNYFTPNEIEWREGEQVRITIGSKLYEGRIVRIKGKRKKMFALSIPDTAFATIEITPEIMQSIEKWKVESGRSTPFLGHTKWQNRAQHAQIPLDDRDDHKSKDLEGDKKLLFETAFKLLFILTNQQKVTPVGQMREYQVTLKEVERAMKRLSSYKGYTATMEGELALPMFLGANATGQDIEGATERLQKAIERLKDSSFLKLRMRFYLAKLTNHKAELDSIINLTQGWKSQPLQKKQKEFLNEIKGIL